MQTKTKISAIVKYTILTIALFFAIPKESHAVRALPGMVEVTQPDGSKLKVQAHGDDYFNYTTTADGYIVALGADGFLYYADYNTGVQRISNVRVGTSTRALNMTRMIPAGIIDMQREKMIQVERMAKAAQRTPSRAGEQNDKVLVILAQFSDKSFTQGAQAWFDGLLNTSGHASVASKISDLGSAADYFKDNSGGAYNPTFVVTDVVTLPNTVAYYTSGSSAQQLALDAALAADPSVDFSEFSTDGIVNGFMVIFAGYSGSETGGVSGPWPHKYTIEGGHTVDGKTLHAYARVAELRGTTGTTNLAGIGTFAHEFSHILGLTDLYATGPSPHNAVKSWGLLSLMNNGNYNNNGFLPPYLTSHEREMLGWLVPQEINSTDDYVLEKIGKNKAYKISTGNPGEYFLLENRYPEKWDRYLYVGMLIWHMDFSQNNVSGITAAQRWERDEPNMFAGHMCARLVEASSSNIETITKLYFPGTGNVTSIGYKTSPSIEPWSQKNLGIEISKIAIDGENVKFSIKKTAIDPAKTQIYGTVVNQEGHTLGGVTVSLYDPAQSSEQEGISQYIKTYAAPLQTAVTNARGGFEFINVQPMTYKIEAMVEGYEPYSITRSFTEGAQVMDKIILKATDNNPDKNIMKWHNNNNSMVISFNGEAVLWAAVRFQKEDQAKYPNNFSKVTAVVEGDKEVELIVKYGDKTIHTQTEMPSAGLVTFDLSQAGLSKDNTGILDVIIKTYNGLAIDQITPTVNNKGNLISQAGTDWVSLSSAFAYEGNWLISVEMTDTKAQAAPFPAIALTKDEYVIGDKISLKLNNANEETIEKTKYTVNNSTVSGSNYTLSKSGIYTILAEITYKDGGGVETITRKITVK